MTTKKKEAPAKGLSAKKVKELSFATEPRVKVKVLKAHDGHKKGDVIEVTIRKVRDSSRPMKQGFYQVLEQVNV